MSQPLQSSKANPLSGSHILPGDKSISHRSLILASQAIGHTKITGLLEGDDVLRTASALQALGVSIDKKKDEWHVSGIGSGALQQPADIIDCGNSGTGVRLLMGLVASNPIQVTFTGDKSLRGRPMQRITQPLEKMGAQFTTRKSKATRRTPSADLLPITVHGSPNLWPISYTLPMASAQVKSAILLAALNIPGKTTVVEPALTRDHTELMLKYLGAELESEIKDGANHITLTGQTELFSRDLDVPVDPSSAAFFVVAAMLTPGSDITIKNVCINPLRTGLFRTLYEMGGKIALENQRVMCGENVADLRVAHSQLKGFSVPASWAPSMIDEYPILAVAASFAEGQTIMNGLEELRVKESDRLSAIAAGLKACGVDHKIEGDSLIVNGSADVRGGGMVQTHHDHRIAMSFLIMGMASQEPVTVDSGDMINTSFPEFVNLINKAGANMKAAS